MELKEIRNGTSQTKKKWEHPEKNTQLEAVNYVRSMYHVVV